LGRLFFRVSNRPKEGIMAKQRKHHGGFKVKATKKMEHEFGHKSAKKGARKRARKASRKA
jgi:hypothetical protein